MENNAFIIILICGIIISGFLIFLLKRIFAQSSTSESNFNYQNYSKKEYLLTRSELTFFKTLSEALLETNFYICPQVKLEDLITINSNDYKVRNKIKQKHIDFVITNRENMKIICAIELDDYTHDRLDRQERDIFVEGLFNSINLKLLRYRNEYSKEILLRDILDSTRHPE
jgi:hypothetical protein